MYGYVLVLCSDFYLEVRGQHGDWFSPTVWVPGIRYRSFIRLGDKHIYPLSHVFCPMGELTSGIQRHLYL